MAVFVSALAFGSAVFAGAAFAGAAFAGALFAEEVFAAALPFTMGFVGEDVLFHAVIEHYPWMGIGVLITAAFNGINLYRLQATLFGGDHSEFGRTTVNLRTRHRLALATMGLFSVMVGIFPGPLLEALRKIV